MTFYRCLDFTKKYFLFKWLPLGNHNFRQIIPETFILNTRENLVPWGKITFYIYALQTHPLCRYWNHLASQAPFPWDSKCYLKVIIGTYLSLDRESCEINSLPPHVISHHTLQVVQSPHSVVLPGYTGGVSGCLPILWNIQTQWKTFIMICESQCEINANPFGP